MHVGNQDEADLPAVDFPHLHLRIAEHLHVAVPAVVVQRGGPNGPSRLVMVPREDPHLDARTAQGLDDVPPDHLPEHRGHMGAVEQVAEDAEQGGAVFDRPASGLREVAVEVERAFRDARFRIDPEVETQALVDIAHTDDLVHPGVRKATWLLIMSTRRSAKVSNDAARTYGIRRLFPAGNGASARASSFSTNRDARSGTSGPGRFFVAPDSARGRPTSRGGFDSVPPKPDPAEKPSGATPARSGRET